MLFVKLKGASAAVNVMPLYAPAPTLKSPASDTLENASASNLGTRFVHGGKVTCPAARNCGGVAHDQVFSKNFGFFASQTGGVFKTEMLMWSDKTYHRPAA